MATVADVDLRTWYPQPESPTYDGAFWDAVRGVWFFGYPYVSLSSITINSIVTADTSTEAPMALFASASDVSAVGTRTETSTAIRPYLDLEYRWELTHSDGSAIEDLEGIVDPRDNSSVNPYTDQISPEFTCIIREAGTYTLTLTARGMSTTFGTIIEQTATKSITVTASSLDRVWYDVDNGNDANDGLDPWGFALTTATYTESTKELTQAGAFTSYVHDVSVPFTQRDNYIYITKAGFEGLYKIASKTSNDTIVLADGLGSDQTSVTSSDGAKQTWSGALVSGTEIMLKGGGSSYDITSPSTSENLANPVAITGYNGKPTVTSTTGVTLFDAGIGDSQSMPEYFRATNIDYDAQDGRGTASGNTINGTISSTVDSSQTTIILDDCNAQNSNDDNGVQIQNVTGTKQIHLLFYKLFAENRYLSTGKAVSRMAIYTNIKGGWQRGVGLLMNTSSDNSVLDHFWYPNGDMSYFHCAYSETRECETGTGFALNLNRDDVGEARYNSVVCNKFGNNSNFVLDASAASNVTDTKYFNDVLFSQNLCNPDLTTIFAYSPHSITSSWNQAWGSSDGRGFHNLPPGSGFDADNFELVCFSNEVYGQTLLEDYNNGTTKEIMDNTCWQVADLDILRYDAVAQGSRQMAVDGNNLYAPAILDGLLVDEGLADISLADLNTDFSATNTSTLPSWTDASTGDFDGVPVGIEVDR